MTKFSTWHAVSFSERLSTKVLDMGRGYSIFAVMDREIAKIIERLEALKQSADKLGKERGQFIRHLEIAEAQLEAARHEVEGSRGKQQD